MILNCIEKVINIHKKMEFNTTKILVNMKTIQKLINSTQHSYSNLNFPTQICYLEVDICKLKLLLSL